MDDEEEPDRRTLLKLACTLPAAGGIGELLLRLLEAGTTERRVAKYGTRLVETHPPEIPAQAVTSEQDRRSR